MKAVASFMWKIEQTVNMLLTIHHERFSLKDAESYKLRILYFLLQLFSNVAAGYSMLSLLQL